MIRWNGYGNICFFTRAIFRLKIEICYLVLYRKEKGSLIYHYLCVDIFTSIISTSRSNIFKCTTLCQLIILEQNGNKWCSDSWSMNKPYSITLNLMNSSKRIYRETKASAYLVLMANEETPILVQKPSNQYLSPLSFLNTLMNPVLMTRSSYAAYYQFIVIYSII